MTAPAAASLVALAVGVGVVGLGSIGLYRARDAFGRPHYGGPANIVGPLAATVALAFGTGLASPMTIRGVILSILMATTGPIVAHAIARAARLRSRGTLEVRPDDAGAQR